MVPLVLVALSLAFSISRAFGWGAAGHNATAVIAQHLLNDNATKLAKFLLGGDGDLEAICSWADRVRGPESEYHFSTIWHTAYVPPFSCTYNFERDCASRGGCADTAIRNYTARLIDSEKKLPQLEHEVALKFLVHFIGDIHQPLHAGWRQTGPSGNFLGSHGTLHAAWDTLLIKNRLKENFGNNATAWQQYLLKKVDALPQQQTMAWVTCYNEREGEYEGEFRPCPHEWISEGAAYSCRAGYQNEKGGWIDVKDEFELGEPYYHANIQLVEYRVMQAGVRMAHALNTIADTIAAQGGWSSHDVAQKVNTRRHHMYALDE